MSRIQVSHYINFQGRAGEAMGFYRRVLGGRQDPDAAGRAALGRPGGWLRDKFGITWTVTIDQA
ncbi:MAG: hypothetical protein H0T68_12660 [Gemmatimonadales bacterium]|nr:hypothetical protein [Gemmatimonadales bacterium]